MPEIKEIEKFARRVRRIEPSATMAVVDKAATMKSNGRDIIDLGVGEPDCDTPPHIKQAAINALNAGHTRYTKNVGIDELRQAITTKLKRVNQLEYEPEQVIVCNGGKHALFNAMMAVLGERDEIIIFSPYWVTFPEMAKLAGADPVIIETSDADGFEPDLDLVLDKISSRTRAILINSPSNPSGAVYSDRTIRGLVEIARENELFILSDECYDQIVYETEAISPAFYEKGSEHVITVQSMSKSYAMTGWRIGYAAASREVIKNMAKIQSQSTSHPNSIAQHAAVQALKGDQSFLADMLAKYRKRRDYLIQRLSDINGFTLGKPAGAFYVFPNVESYFGMSNKGFEIASSLDLAHYLLQEYEVVVVPGEGFGAPGHIRLSYSTSMEELERGVERIENALISLK